MSYTPPSIWEHGDYPTAPHINKFKTGLDAIHDLLGDYQINTPVTARMGSIELYTYVNRHRWLIYMGDGTLSDPSGVGEDVTLSGDGGNWVSYDLWAVDWLTEGMLYQVRGVDVCFEDYESY